MITRDVAAGGSQHPYGLLWDSVHFRRALILSVPISQSILLSIPFLRNPSQSPVPR